VRRWVAVLPACARRLAARRVRALEPRSLRRAHTCLPASNELGTLAPPQDRAGRQLLIVQRRDVAARAPPGCLPSAAGQHGDALVHGLRRLPPDELARDQQRRVEGAYHGAGDRYVLGHCRGNRSRAVSGGTTSSVGRSTACVLVGEMPRHTDDRTSLTPVQIHVGDRSAEQESSVAQCSVSRLLADGAVVVAVLVPVVLRVAAALIVAVACRIRSATGVKTRIGACIARVSDGLRFG
jgi:hypothetical protein